MYMNVTFLSILSTRKEHTNASIEFILNILKQYQTEYIIIPSFRTKTFIHLQGKYPQTICMCLCIIPELNYV